MNDDRMDEFIALQRSIGALGQAEQVANKAVGGGPGAPARPQATKVEVTRTQLHVTFLDGRYLSVPLEWFPRLRTAAAAGRLAALQNVELLGGGIGLHWPALDEDLSVRGLLMALEIKPRFAGEDSDPATGPDDNTHTTES